MKDMLETIKGLRKPANSEHVAYLIKQLGDAPSIATIEEVLKHYKRVEKKLLSEDLLDWMMENDQMNFETEDLKVSIKTYVTAKLADEFHGFKWLMENGYGDLIKTSVDFPKGEFTDQARDTLESMGLSFTLKEGIHHQSLKKIISDRLDAGDDLPDEDNGIKVSYYDECVIKEK